jgi:sugar O-acyltransferase (sialic acid O-acetyltransferase NeuD family)
MGIEKLTILGLSEPTLTMIFDNLESCRLFPEIKIVNNLGLNELKPFENLEFTIDIVKDISSNNDKSGFFLGVIKPYTKLAVFNNYAEQNLSFINIIHTTSSVSSTVELGQGVLINSLVSIAGFTKIGDFVSINRNASVGHHTEIANFVTLSPGTNVAGFVKIGENTLVGMGANVIDGITIGRNSIIGAGSLVTKDIPDGVIAYGNPCKIIRDNQY